MFLHGLDPETSCSPFSLYHLSPFKGLMFLAFSLVVFMFLHVLDSRTSCSPFPSLLPLDLVSMAYVSCFFFSGISVFTRTRSWDFLVTLPPLQARLKGLCFLLFLWFLMVQSQPCLEDMDYKIRFGILCLYLPF